jgi:hypothetical protein
MVARFALQERGCPSRSRYEFGLARKIPEPSVFDGAVPGTGALKFLL